MSIHINTDMTLNMDKKYAQKEKTILVRYTKYKK